MIFSLTEEYLNSGFDSFFSSAQHRQLLRSRENNYRPLKIAELTINEEYAHKFVDTFLDVYHFKPSQRKDVKVTINI